MIVGAVQRSAEQTAVSVYLGTSVGRHFVPSLDNENEVLFIIAGQVIRGRPVGEVLCSATLFDSLLVRY